MRWDLSELAGYRVHALDGNLGRVADIYFDDVEWRVRYLAVAGRRKAQPRKFLLTPEVISHIDRESGLLSVNLKTAEVHDSPAVLGGLLTRQEEINLRAYYAWPDYWAALGLAQAVGPASAVDNPRLHSLAEVQGYRVLTAGSTEDIGPLTELILNDRAWKIYGIEVDVSSWLPAGRVWVRSADIEQVCRAAQKIDLSVRREAIAERPTPDRQVLAVPGGEMVSAGDGMFPSQPFEGPSLA